MCQNSEKTFSNHIVLWDSEVLHERIGNVFCCQKCNTNMLCYGFYCITSFINDFICPLISSVSQKHTCMSWICQALHLHTFQRVHTISVALWLVLWSMPISTAPECGKPQCVHNKLRKSGCAMCTLCESVCLRASSLIKLKMITSTNHIFSRAFRHFLLFTQDLEIY